MNEWPNLPRGVRTAWQGGDSPHDTLRGVCVCVSEMWGVSFFKEGTHRTGKSEGTAPPQAFLRRHRPGLQGCQGAELTMHALQDAENLSVSLICPQQLETRL